jgi:predicted ribosome quality control (RQC) complex YloA/Tae2 family protein
MTQGSARASLKSPFDSITLRAVVCELRDRLTGGQVQDIRQPSAAELRIGVRAQGSSHILAMSCDARFARAHLTQQRSANAQAPPSFCMSLRKHCEGAIVRDVRQRAFDRIVEIEIGARSPAPDSATTVLIAELMGKHSNLILVDANGTILEAAKRISHRVNRVRELLPGLAYQPPPAQSGRLDPFDSATIDIAMAALAGLGPDAAKDWLLENVAGVSPFLAQSIAAQIGGTRLPSADLRGAWDATFGAAARGGFRPVAIFAGGTPVGAYPFPAAHLPADAQRPVHDLNAALDAAFADAVTRANASAVVSELRGSIDRDRKRLVRQREMAERTLREGVRAEEYKQAGELVLANLWRAEPGASALTVQDYFDPALGDRTIALDTKLTPQENAEALFRRYRKVRDGQATAASRRAKADALLERLDAASSRLALLEEDDRAAEQVAALRDELRTQGLLLQRSQDSAEAAPAGPDMQGHKIRRFTTPEGYEIYLGETATANDYLTLRLAASNDLWLHVRSSTSAHVVVKTQGRPDSVPRAVIEYAALLCARHSSQKHSGLVPVDYTLKKHVRKPRGAAPGSADYHHETTVHVTP